MTATVKDMEDLVDDPAHRKEALQCRDSSLELAFKLYEGIKREITDPSKLSMTLLFLGSAGIAITMGGDKSQELRMKAFESSLYFMHHGIKDFIEYEAREVH